ncbi:hypothetical protein [Xenorhabdus bovienii]|uniref:Uncharacterized protein n=3 Tax=Xenorhabdus bovienii TaxID=40576 RepID=A0A0B6XB54_XENBV|nr:hypothetical protein [Xenorhabdus bovienii]CDG99825.1 hypothetical protein XBFM1_1210015 [Xenorhabdus bovienii str. feltiae Moldova]CDH23777.1 hypothetical protein XBKB1_2040009 [Xenorhabdus bovienii str. kraussei Becker Underwood]CDM90416.1 conserved protein of unknown function [Xenorhabdus bovienii]
MKTKFNHSAVHKNLTRERETRSVTEQGCEKLRDALEDAKLRLEHREELTGGKRHE